ncbi:MAG TPA: hypothetical protein ENF43_02715 [Thermoplasmatales archaeon]|nr:hypothetical protein [Thermoplasmatales archaeon]
MMRDTAPPKFKLAKFIELLRRENIHDFDVDKFDSRIRLQKYVYIAKNFFDIDLGYNFGLYIRGPYSTDLADDYYSIGEIPSNELPDSLIDMKKFEKFREFIKEYNEIRDLETITTIHFLNEVNKHLVLYSDASREMLKSFIIERTSELKKLNKKKVEELYDMLLDRGFLS